MKTMTNTFVTSGLITTYEDEFERLRDRLLEAARECEVEAEFGTPHRSVSKKELCKRVVVEVPLRASSDRREALEVYNSVVQAFMEAAAKQ